MLLALAVCRAFAAQEKMPKWLEKQRRALVEITTYNKDNVRLRTGTGFFVSATGEILASYTVFSGADRAEARDMSGNTYQIESVIGADEMYDVIKVRAAVPKKVNFLDMALQGPAEGGEAYLLPFSTAKEARYGQGTVMEVTKLKGDYGYYQLSIPLDSAWVDSPVLTAEGKVFGLAQADASGKNEHSYAVSAAYANSLKLIPMDALNTTYSSLGIRKAWPSSIDDAQIMLIILQSKQDAPEFLETVDYFISTFPDNPDGYLTRATLYAYSRDILGTPGECLLKARDDIRAYQERIPNKGDGFFNEAKLLYGVAISDTTLNDPTWNVSHALEVLQQALNISDEPLYHQLKADIYLSQGKAADAFDEYMVVNRSSIATPSTWYMAAKLREEMPNVNIGEIISLLDSAVVASGSPVGPEAAPYILERIDWRLKLMQYDEAVADYDLYYQLLHGQVNDSFYYYREQAKFRQGNLEGALADIREAIRLNPDNPNYHAEEAAVLIRQKEYAQAVQSIEKALGMEPEFASCYRLLGLCLVQEGNKIEACNAFQRAVDLGDTVAARLLKENCE